MLKAPANHQLCRATAIFRTQRLDRRVFHSEGASERRVGFDDDIVALAEGRYVCMGVEGMDFHLVDCRVDARIGS